MHIQHRAVSRSSVTEDAFRKMLFDRFRKSFEKIEKNWLFDSQNLPTSLYR